MVSVRVTDKKREPYGSLKVKYKNDRALEKQNAQGRDTNSAHWAESDQVNVVS
jgi:hypothetical protein